ncbi:SDR family oxidoreductase [Rahnella inusitata]|jgi:NAD(P)-dependent dehydrogenase (short-subunit alcohol dehydrogenase family)|uniref:SDR family oxidoreductase n=1 Tax=Rahnella TaxID=34037 RepID=UPI0039B1135E
MLHGKKIVVTGGGRHFGRALSIWFAREGADVSLCSRNVQQAVATANKIQNEGGIARAYQCDIADIVSVRQFAALVVADQKPIDILVLSAAQWLDGALASGESDEEIFSTINSGLTGSVLLTKALLPHMNRVQGSDIVAINSSCGVPNFTESVAHPAFFAAKQGLGAFCHKISKTLSADNIRVTSLYPPDFETLDIDEDISLHDRTGQSLLTGQSVWQTLKFVVTQPRSCHISAIHFQGPTREDLIA